jgi:hypothetical protein
MSLVKIQSNASGTGTLTIAAPNTNTDRTLTLPDATGTLNTSGAVNEVPAGSASAPSIYPTGDTNTGIFFPAADTIALSTAGTERTKIDSAGILIQGSGGTGSNRAEMYLNAGSTSGTYGMVSFRKNNTQHGVVCHRSGAIGGTSNDLALFAETGLGIYTYTNGGTAGPYVASGGTSWTSSSDERLKNITGEIQNGLTKVCAIRAAEFTWKNDETAKPQVGLVAQDVEVVLPEVVTRSVISKDDQTEYLGVSYTEVIPLLVAAIKELKVELDAAKERIAALEAK